MLGRMTGWESSLILPGKALVIILYSFFGGQNSTLKTDLLQQAILVGGIIGVLAKVFEIRYLAVYGMIASTVIALAAVWVSRRRAG